MPNSSVTRYALAISAALLALGCGASVPPRCDDTETITLRLHPAPHLNPDRAGFPRAVALHVYQLEDTRRFRTSTFDRLWQDRADTLIALPGRERAHALRRDPKASYLAIAANFRERSGESDWRMLVRLPAPQDPCAQWPAKRRPPIELELSDYELRLR